MYLACASVCYRWNLRLNRWGDDEVDTCLADAPQAGYDYVELQGRLKADTIGQQLRSHGLKGAVVGASIGGSNPEEIEAAAIFAAERIDLGETLGGRFLYTGPASGCRRREPGNMERFVAGVERVLELTSESSMTLAIENHPEMILTCLEDWDRLFGLIDHPRVGICVDVGHFHSCHQDSIALIRTFGARVFDVHLKDHIAEQSVAIGRGEIDIPGVVDALHAVGYRGPLTVELEVEDKPNIRRYVREAYLYLKGMLGQKL